MARSGERFAGEGVFSRFLKQKGGLANIFMATFCCALSVRLLQQRKEHEDLVETLETTFAAERDSLRLEIDAMRGRGWVGKTKRSKVVMKTNPDTQNSKADTKATPAPVSKEDKKAAAKGGIFI